MTDKILCEQMKLQRNLMYQRLMLQDYQTAQR